MELMVWLNPGNFSCLPIVLALSDEHRFALSMTGSLMGTCSLVGTDEVGEELFLLNDEGEARSFHEMSQEILCNCVN